MTIQRKRVTSVTRNRQILQFVADVQKPCTKHGFHIRASEITSSIAIYDDREKRPSTWPVAAFTDSIGGVPRDPLHLQTFELPLRVK